MMVFAQGIDRFSLTPLVFLQSLDVRDQRSS